MGALFTFDKLGLLHDPHEWASMKFFSFARNTELIAEHFLTHSDTPIHAPLTMLDPGPLSKEAIKMFRNIMGYMGDRKAHRGRNFAATGALNPQRKAILMRPQGARKAP